MHEIYCGNEEVFTTSHVSLVTAIQRIESKVLDAIAGAVAMIERLSHLNGENRMAVVRRWYNPFKFQCDCRKALIAYNSHTTAVIHPCGNIADCHVLELMRCHRN